MNSVSAGIGSSFKIDDDVVLVSSVLWFDAKIGLRGSTFPLPGLVGSRRPRNQHFSRDQFNPEQTVTTSDAYTSSVFSRDESHLRVLATIDRGSLYRLLDSLN